MAVIARAADPPHLADVGVVSSTQQVLGAGQEEQRHPLLGLESLDEQTDGTRTRRHDLVSERSLAEQAAGHPAVDGVVVALVGGRALDALAHAAARLEHEGALVVERGAVVVLRRWKVRAEGRLLLADQQAGLLARHQHQAPAEGLVAETWRVCPMSLGRSWPMVLGR